MNVNLFVILVSAVLPASALRVHQRPYVPELGDEAVPVWADAHELRASRNGSVSWCPAVSLISDLRRQDRIADDTVSVPDIDTFKEQWTVFKNYGVSGFTDHGSKSKLRAPASVRGRQSQRPAEPSKRAAEMRIVVGIFSRSDQHDEPYRDVIRNTWMTQKYICHITHVSRKTPDCRIFATFVVGSQSAPSIAARVSAVEQGEGYLTETSRRALTDITVLNISENMNCGKTRAWFTYAHHKYPTATHIAKMDMDAWVDMRTFWPIAETFEDPCPYMYGGRTWHCPDDRYCPPMGCGRPVATSFWGYDRRNVNASEDCWTYMQGGFYFMTRLLAGDISRQDGWWHNESANCYPEDAMVGKAIQKWGIEHGQVCIATMDLVAREVIWHADFKEFWYSTKRGKPE